MLITIFDKVINPDSIEAIWEETKINPDFVPSIEGVCKPQNELQSSPNLFISYVRSLSGKEYIFENIRLQEITKILNETTK